MATRFTFIGTLKANKKPESNGYFYREGKTGKGAAYCSVNLQVEQEKNNLGYVELFGMVSDTIKTMNKEMKKIEINWEDRFDGDSLDQVADFKKNVIKIGDDKNEFISSYDAVKFINEHIDELDGQKVLITGQRKKNIYNGKISDRFELNSIKTLDESDSVNKLTVNMELIYNKESFDIADWKEEHKLIINGYTEEYISDIKENRYVPQQIIFDCSKIQWDNPDHVQKVNARLSMLNCTLDDDNRIVIKAKAKKIYQVGMTTSFINGQEKVEFDESMLTDKQKEFLELGLKTLDDFRPAGQIFGTRVLIYKLRDFDLRAEGKYVDGSIIVDLTEDEFDEKIYHVAETITEDEALNETESKNDDDEDDDLFG